MEDKKIVIVSNFSFSEPVSTNRIRPFLELLLAEGLNVVFVCPQDEANNKACPKDVILVEVELKPEKPKSFIKRALKEASDVAVLLKAARNEQANAYLVTIPSMFLTFLAPFYLRKKNVFLDVRDLTWEYLSNESSIQRLSKTLFRFLFKKTINSYQLVSVTNTTELAYVKKVWKGESAPLLVSNGIALEQFKKLEKVLPSTNEKLIVTYIGKIGIAQHLDNLVEAAKVLPDVLFKIVGTGIEFDKIENFVLNSGLKNVELTGQIPWDSVKDYYDNTDVLYAQLTPDFSGAMPSKLYEYLSTGKYVIYGGQGQAADILSEFSNNEVIQPCETLTLINAIKAAESKVEKNKLCLENRVLIKNQYIREETAKNLIREIKRVVSC